MISKQVKRCSVSLIIREINNETLLKYQFLPNRLLNIQMFDTILLVKYFYTLLVGMQNHSALMKRHLVMFAKITNVFTLDW